LFGIQNIVVVHHSHCGATTFTADGIIDAYKWEHHADISDLYERGSICTEDYEASLKRDTALIRSHAGTPRTPVPARRGSRPVRRIRGILSFTPAICTD
jgi:carbonic anhydrase